VTATSGGALVVVYPDCSAYETDGTWDCHAVAGPFHAEFTRVCPDLRAHGVKLYATHPREVAVSFPDNTTTRVNLKQKPKLFGFLLVAADGRTKLVDWETQKGSLRQTLSTFWAWRTK
jgi:hypothetical protein